MPLSLFRKSSYVGLDIGHHTIKAVQMERTASGWRVVHVDSVPTPVDSVKDGVVVGIDEVAQSIREVLKHGRIAATSVNIAVAGGSVVVRTVRIPKMAESQLRKSIKFEASRYVPSSVEDSYVEFEILGEAPDSQMDVLIVAAPREIVESRVKACEKAGLDVEVVDIEAFASYRALVEIDADSDWKSGSVALVDVGSSSTNVSVVTDGVFAMTRSIPQGGETITEALRTYFGLELTDAESGKTQLDLNDLIKDSGPIENPPLRVIQPHVDDLVREIRRSLNYYQSQLSDQQNAKPVESLLLTGGGAKLTGLADYFANRLGVSVKAYGVLESPHVLSSGDEQGSGLDLSVAAGLAMRAPKAA